MVSPLSQPTFLTERIFFLRDPQVSQAPALSGLIQGGSPTGRLKVQPRDCW